MGETFTPKEPRVFGIGLSRTGTTSLAQALGILGWTSIHNPIPTRFAEGDFSLFDREFDAAADISVAAFYKELDEAYPGSRFVLTLRDAESWLKSVIVHFANLPKNSTIGARGEVRERVYGHKWPKPEQFLASYKRHITEVAQYFGNRPDLLVLDTTQGGQWDRLCAFLGEPVPVEPYPHSNPTTPMQHEKARLNLEAGRTEGTGVILPLF